MASEQSLSLFSLVPRNEDGTQDDPVALPLGETTIGRGPLLKVRFVLYVLYESEMFFINNIYFVNTSFVSHSLVCVCVHVSSIFRQSLYSFYFDFQYVTGPATGLPARIVSSARRVTKYTVSVESPCKAVHM